MRLERLARPGLRASSVNPVPRACRARQAPQELPGRLAWLALPDPQERPGRRVWPVPPAPQERPDLAVRRERQAPPVP